MTSWMWTWDIFRPGIGEVGVYEKHSSKFDSFASIFQPCYVGLQESLNHPTWTRFLRFGSWILFLPFKEIWQKGKIFPKRKPSHCQVFVLKYVLVATSIFFFGLYNCINMRSEATGVRGNWIHPKDVQCSNQAGLQGGQLHLVTLKSFGMTGNDFDSFPATSISRTSSLLLSKQESSGSFELHRLVEDWTNHVWIQHVSPQSAPDITGWILDFCHNSRCTILSVASWSSWCDFSDIFISSDLLGEVLQWRSKKRWTKSTVFPWGMRTPSQDSWPSLCLCHPHWSTRNCLMSKNLTRPHELLLKCK